MRHLVGAGIEATAIHGNKSQPQRERALAGFRDGQARVLVATDIAARGIDVDGVSHVINFELPNVAEDYVHRVGRTARAGAAGIAIAFCSDEERPYLRDIEKLTRCSLRAIPSATPAPAARNGPIEQPAEVTASVTFGLASRPASAGDRAAQARRGRRGAADGGARRSDAHRDRFASGLSSPPVADETRLGQSPRGVPPFLATRLGGAAERKQRRARDMLIAREGEELVCPKGTICGRMTRDANDRIIDGDFAVLETCVSPDSQRYVCACCERAVAVQEHFRWRLHLRRGWIR